MKSMTGYGKGVALVGGKSLTAEIKSVNHRYLDFNIKMPKLFLPYEDLIRSVVSEKIQRGHLDVYLTYVDGENAPKEVSVDFSLAAGWLDAARRLQKEYALKDDFQLNALMKVPDIVKLQPKEEDPELMRSLLTQALQTACDELNRMRAKEGEKLKTDLLKKAETIEANLQKIEKIAPTLAKDYGEKLLTRVGEILKDIPVDENRLMTEIAFFADRSCIDEEITRLKSHIAQFRSMCDEEPIGRKLDFLIQEFNRETNTICSKSADVTLTKIGLEMKNEIEKIREQAQNIE